VLAEQGQPDHDALVEELEAEWAAESAPWEAAAHIILDDVIDPRQTREVIANGIEFAWPSGPRVTPSGCTT
jgi:acetyl-CoA carboxylase carboxyltransferase component